MTGVRTWRHVWPECRLNDRIIGAAQKLLEQQSVNICGWQPTVYEQRSTKFKVLKEEEDFVQVLHVEKNHWITVSNIHCDVGHVNIYDSMFTNKLSLATKQQICSFWKSGSSVATFRIVNMQRQYNTKDCGLFAIATATDLAHKKDPLLSKWDMPKMREHLVGCFENKKMSCFPIKEKRILPPPVQLYFKEIREKLYCICHMPNDKTIPMICCDQCNKWFHNSCMQLDKRVAQNFMWKCGLCDD